MSLYKQMVIFVTLCIIGVFAIIMISVIDHDRDMIENQLHVNAKNSASFLGLTISKNVDLNDTPTLEGMLNSILDNGFYRSITVKNEDSKILTSVRRENSSSVPSWFSSLVSIDSLTSSADIMKGWLNKGEVMVVIDDNYALGRLWDAFKVILYIFCISTLLVLVILYILLNYLLSPLKKLDKQAQAIDSNKFIIVQENPTTTEFASVTNAMNKSIKKLKGIFTKEIDIFRKYNRLLYTDEELRIGNRKFMMLKLEDNLKHSFGCFMFVEILDRAEVKNALGYISFISFVTFVINNCDDIFGGNKNFVVAKLNEETLAILLPYQEYKDIEDKVEEFYQSINSHIKHAKLDENYKIELTVGVTNYAENEPISELLIRTNESLQKASQKEKKINYTQIGKDFKHANKDLFTISLAKNANVEFEKIGVYDTLTERFNLVEYFPKLSIADDDERYSRELVIGISDDKTKIKLQKHILKKLFEKIKKGSTKQHISIKLAKEFAIDKESVNWLADILRTKYGDGKIKFYFECLNKDIHAKRQDYEHLVNILRKLNHEFAVETYAFENNNFEYLKVLRPKYIKISKSYITHDMSNISKDILENITVALGSRLIVKNIDDENDFTKIDSLNVSNMQGRFLKMLEDGNG